MIINLETHEGTTDLFLSKRYKQSLRVHRQKNKFKKYTLLSFRKRFYVSGSQMGALSGVKRIKTSIYISELGD